MRETWGVEVCPSVHEGTRNSQNQLEIPLWWCPQKSVIWIQSVAVAGGECADVDLHAPSLILVLYYFRGGAGRAGRGENSLLVQSIRGIGSVEFRARSKLDVAGHAIWNLDLAGHDSCSLLSRMHILCFSVSACHHFWSWPLEPAFCSMSSHYPWVWPVNQLCYLHYQNRGSFWTLFSSVFLDSNVFKKWQIEMSCSDNVVSKKVSYGVSKFICCKQCWNSYVANNVERSVEKRIKKGVGNNVEKVMKTLLNFFNF